MSGRRLGKSDYLRRCLELFGSVTEIRYGKRQRLEEVEREVESRLAVDAELWDVVYTIYNTPHFDAGVFGPLHVDQIEADLKQSADGKWQELPDHKLIDVLYGAFRQIEPVSVVMRFVYPRRFGIMSSPVSTLVCVRPKRAKAMYWAYVDSLREIGHFYGFERAADVEMALWALQVGVLEKRLPAEQRAPLKDEYENDRQLPRLVTRNLTKQLFSENGELDVAEALLDTKPALAGAIAGIEFEQLVNKRVGDGGEGVEVPVPSRCCREGEERLAELIRRFPPAMHERLNHAKDIRNRAVHCPQCVAKEDVRRLIEIAREVQ